MLFEVSKSVHFLNSLFMHFSCGIQVHLAAGDADAALGGDVCIDAGRGGLGAASVAPPHEGDDDDDDEYDEDEAEFNGGSSGRVRATAAGDDPEADSKAARRKIRAAAIAQQRALAKAEGEVSGYGAQGDGSVRVRVRGGDATRLLCSSSVVNITAPQVQKALVFSNSYIILGKQSKSSNEYRLHPCCSETHPLSLNITSANTIMRPS